ncbi:MAG: bifunctional glutamate N-acetyltransferase/amino-acid acetyltransferase ArgJ [Planctomycetota bacterium]|nr:bifunctional glutamate N-acetyltransferase/amino-acid acetyltransferase ArgJ [Planctomycetota bacterium]
MVTQIVELAGATMEMDPNNANCPAGFEAGGIAAGLRRSGKPDLAIFRCAKGAAAAGVFTQNAVRAAPVDISEGHLRVSGGRTKAIMINSACANAATGPMGFERAQKTLGALAESVNCEREEVLIASTGVIGVQLPDEKMIEAYPALLDSCGAGGLSDASNAILTTDTCAKACEAKVTWKGKTLHVAGVAKGSGMIHPNMATLLGVVMTDADVDSKSLQKMLVRITDRTFNRISVDGDTSTNDCVFAMASGEAGEFPEEIVEEALERVCRELALKIVRDGEGARKFIHVRVTGGACRGDAEKVAATVGGSLLVRTAVAGGDPNWGRILAAIGRAGAPVDIDALKVFAGGALLFENGGPAATDREELVAAFAGPEVLLEIDLGAGEAEAEFFTCDLTEGYIKINAYYTT